ncbi:hypothetical protein AAFF_G00167110 [Aldrovandia affinis]|uniref:Uncharacterized protein n=1 Tax=Aldrovandia affinis TaxID=143900 RepID=A0AAD7RMB7_9TELE|nr:hypothetical protein AAFF_G00167110 [Aldrovandia affinis]
MRERTGTNYRPVRLLTRSALQSVVSDDENSRVERSKFDGSTVAVKVGTAEPSGIRGHRTPDVWKPDSLPMLDPRGSTAAHLLGPRDGRVGQVF